MSSRRTLLERIVFAKVEFWMVGLAVVLSIGLGAIWSYAVIKKNFFPGPALHEIRTAIVGVPGDFRPARSRFLSGLIHSPREFPAENKVELLPKTAFKPVRLARDLGDATPEISGMTVSNPAGETRYFLVYGSFVFDELEKTIGTILIDSNGVIHRAWPSEVEGGEFFGMHIGLALAPNGTFAVNAHGIMTAYGWCGGELWQAPWQPSETAVAPDWNGPLSHDWHHDIVWRDGAFHSLVGIDVVSVDEATGEITGRIQGTDYFHWGWEQGLSLLDPSSRRRFLRPNLTPDSAGRLLPADPFHLNKVDILGADMAAEYPDFEAGDVLLSFRDLNLVTVLRPSEEKFIWWRYGLTSRQHDASFVEGGIEVFNNDPFSDPPQPTILRLDLDNDEAETVFDLSRWKMVMRYTGNFERSGTRLLTVDDYEGRVIAGRTDGSIDFVFENGYDADGGELARLMLRNVTEVSPADFTRLEASCEAGSVTQTEAQSN